MISLLLVLIQLSGTCKLIRAYRAPWKKRCEHENESKMQILPLFSPADVLWINLFKLFIFGFWPLLLWFVPTLVHHQHLVVSLVVVSQQLLTLSHWSVVNITALPLLV